MRKLTLSNLEDHFETLDVEQLRNIKGGEFIKYGDVVVYVYPDGSTTWSWDGGQTWNLPTINAGPGPSYDASDNPWLMSGYSEFLSGGYGNYNGGAIGGGSHSGGSTGTYGGAPAIWGGYSTSGQAGTMMEMGVVNMTGNLTQDVLYQAASWANASLGLSFSIGEGAATYMGTSLPGWFKGASLGMAFVGVVDNGFQFFEDPNITDLAQITAGAICIIVGGEVLIAGALGLYVWELVE